MSFLVRGCFLPFFLSFFLLNVPPEDPTPIGIVFICIGATTMQSTMHQCQCSDISADDKQRIHAVETKQK